MRSGSGDDMRPVRCRNCGQPTGPRFCGHCGQEVADPQRPLLQLAGDLVSEWFSLDGRLARTLGALARPGRLTRAYLDGRRIPYLRPLRLYFFCSLVLFSSALSLRAPRATEVNLVVAGHRASGEQGGGRLDLVVLPDVPRFLPWLVADLDQRLAHLRSLPQQDLIDALFGGLRRVLPAALVLFLPLFAAVLKLLFVRSARLYVDHLVFAVHVQSALFLALATTWVVTRVAGFGVMLSTLSYGLVGLATLAVYLPMALRAVYRQSRVAVAVRSVVILVCYGYLMQASVGLSALLVILRL